MIGRHWNNPDVKYVSRDVSDRQKRHIFLTTVAFDTLALQAHAIMLLFLSFTIVIIGRCCHGAIELDIFVAHF